MKALERLTAACQTYRARDTDVMRFWWMNQNQTFVQETTGGYLYEFMREVAPGDLVLSFEGAHIRVIGVARPFAYECPKAPEFESAGPNWSLIGWKVEVGYQMLTNQVRPADQMASLRPHFPAKYSPLLAAKLIAASEKKHAPIAPARIREPHNVTVRLRGIHSPFDDELDSQRHAVGGLDPVRHRAASQGDLDVLDNAQEHVDRPRERREGV
jgi:hypothetical protein